jgi:uncharacterized protein (DUF58 family)
MEIRYQCELKDYEEVLAARDGKPLKNRILLALLGLLAIMVLVATLFVLFGISLFPATIFVCVGLPILTALSSAIFRSRKRRGFHRHPNFSRPHVARIDENGLHVESEVYTSDTKWTAYVKYQETQNLFLLYPGARLVQAFPKRAFSDQQADEFRHLAQTKLPMAQ